MSFLLSYAGNREDVIISCFFPDITEGFYVDIGANYPMEDSVTKLFYDRGWRGINIEPVEDCIKALNKERTRDINIQAGISETDGTLRLREYIGKGRSTFSSEFKEELSHNTTEPDVQSYSEYEVETLRLDTLFDRYHPPHIHFMKIDVEGLEDKVLISNNWQYYRPELLCIEANHIIHDWHDILKRARYKFVFHDGLNEYYLSEESEYRKQHFNYAEQLLSGPQVIKWTVKREMDEIMSSTTKRYQKRLKRLQARNKETIESLRAKLIYSTSWRGAWRTIWSRVTRRTHKL